LVLLAHVVVVQNHISTITTQLTRFAFGLSVSTAMAMHMQLAQAARTKAENMEAVIAETKFDILQALSRNEKNHVRTGVSRTIGI